MVFGLKNRIFRKILVLQKSSKSGYFLGFSNVVPNDSPDNPFFHLALRDGLSDIESAETCSEKQSVLESVDASLMSHLNESIDSSITAVSTVTVNGNHDDDDDLDCDEEDAEVSAINKMNDSATTYSSLATSVTDSFADTILSVNVTNDNVVGSIDPVVNGLNSLSLDTSIPPISVAALESKLSVIDEPGKAADRCNSAPCDEREAIYPDSRYVFECIFIVFKESKGIT